MKTKAVFKMMAFLLLFVGVWGCSSNDEIKDEYKRCIPSEEITSFFNSKTPDGKETLRYFFEYKTLRVDTCFVVNSRTALRNLYSGGQKLPKIDFTKHSMVIGMVMQSSGFSLDDCAVEVNDDAIVVTVTRKREEIPQGLGITGALFPNYFWGLYEKLPQKDVIVKTKIIE